MICSHAYALYLYAFRQFFPQKLLLRYLMAWIILFDIKRYYLFLYNHDMSCLLQCLFSFVSRLLHAVLFSVFSGSLVLLCVLFTFLYYILFSVELFLIHELIWYVYLHLICRSFRLYYCSLCLTFITFKFYLCFLFFRCSCINLIENFISVPKN